MANEQSWRNSPLQIATVALIGMGFQRYWVEAHKKTGMTCKEVVWAKRVSDIEGLLTHKSRGWMIDRIDELVPSRLDAEMHPTSRSFTGEGGMRVSVMATEGDTIVPPDWLLQIEAEDKREEKAS